ncbi:MAG: 50S ribosomal protein L30 [Deltaproteobacteria bacterium]|nr:50S ribosomal protein L30 [Deltaproteobacteria bacterium]
MTTKLKITQLKSSIGRQGRQAATLAGLGLRKINHTVIVDNTPSFRGMVKKVLHLVKVEEINA